METPTESEPQMTLDEARWRVLNSLHCTVRWLEKGLSVPEAVEELRLNIKMLEEV